MAGNKVSAKEIQALAGLINTNRLAEAEQMSIKLTVRYAGDGVVWKALGTAIALQGRNAEALPSLEKAFNLQPKDAELLHTLGLTYGNLGRLEDAEKSHKKAIGIKPDYAAAYCSLGRLYFGEGRFDEAEYNFRQAIKFAQGNAEAHNGLGATLWSMGRLDEAETYCQQSLRYNPDNLPALNNLGNILSSLGNKDAAVETYKLAIKLKPDWGLLYFHLHALLLDESDLAPALESMTKAVELSPESEEFRFHLGMLLEFAGHAEQAKEHLRMVEHGSAPIRAKLDAWRYLQGKATWLPEITGYNLQTFRRGIEMAIPEGLVLEFGVRFGASIRQIAALVDQPVHGFDSFEGLPEQWHHEPKGSYSTKGKIPAVSENVTLHAGWFEETLPAFLDGHRGPVRFVNIDCDIYSSTKTIFTHLANRIVPGTVIVFDEYIGNEHWRQDEFKAFQEAVTQYDWEYEYISFSFVTKQVVVRIMRVGKEQLGQTDLLKPGSWLEARQEKSEQESHTAAESISLTVDQALQQAIRHHQAGRLQEAEHIYRAILQAQPQHPDANHNLGVLAIGVGNPEGALPFLKAALNAHPAHGQYWLSYIEALLATGRLQDAQSILEQGLQRGLAGTAVDALRQRISERSQKNPQAISELFAQAVQHCQAGRYSEAEQLFHQILLRDAQHADSIHLLGVIAHQRGNHELAVETIRKAIALNNNVASYHSNLGNALKKQGKLNEAVNRYEQALAINPNQADTIYNLGVALRDQGKLNEAIECYRQVLAIKPDYIEAHNNLGNVFMERGEFDKAVSCFKQTLAIKPDYAKAIFNLGNALKEQNKLNEAVDSYKQALTVQPDFTEALFNLGGALAAQGKLDDAIASYKQALAIKPDYVEALYNLAIAYHDQEKLDEAVSSLQEVIRLKPRHFEAYSKLGAIFLQQGKFGEAVLSHIHALLIDENTETKKGFALCVKDVSFSHPETTIESLVKRAISEAWTRPGDLFNAGLSLVMSHKDIKECIDRVNHVWPKRLSEQELFGNSGLALVAGEPLLQSLLENLQISSVELERFLTMVRHIMLAAVMSEEKTGHTTESIASGKLENQLLTFYCALARQCFINEYVFTHTDAELAQAELLRSKLTAHLKEKKPVPAMWLVAVAAYFPLTSLPFIDNLITSALPESVSALFAQQVCEPREDQHFRAHIPALTAIDDDISRLVREQYEENPYPRWVATPSTYKPVTVDDYLRRNFLDSSFKPLGKSDEVDILIAGCGTGQHSIQTAQIFCGANVLAVDLSLSSLSYAKRKTEKLGLRNIEYAQADIMKLGAIGKTFDVIESVGVLHHLADPVAGWRVLLSLLRPSGFMFLGFYSEIARRQIVAVRDYIAKRGYAANANDIRWLRQELMSDANVEQFKLLLWARDFYGMSECRDLLFHAQEHRYTLLQIKDILEALKLRFVGFTESRIVKQYKVRFPDDLAATNLDNWHVLETENPDMFIGMYQFWVQKCE